MRPYVLHDVNNHTRWERFLQEMQVQNWSGYELFPATMLPRHPRMGISKSFKGIIRTAMALKLKEVWIMEDDVMFLDSESIKMFLVAYKHCPEDADMFMAGIYDGKIEQPINGISKVTGRLSGLHCFIMREKFYERALEANENLNIDYWWTEESLGGAKAYVCNPFVAIQHDGLSSNTKMETRYNPDLHRRYPLLNK